MVIIFRIIYNTKKPSGNGLTYVASYTLFWLKFSQVFIYPRYCFKSIPHSISYCLFVISYTMEVVKIVQNSDIVAFIATVANSRQKASARRQLEIMDSQSKCMWCYLLAQITAVGGIWRYVAFILWESFWISNNKKKTFKSLL